MPIEGKQPARKPPRTYEVWQKVKARLVTGNFTNLLLGAGRIYVAGDQHPPTEGSLDIPWGRLVVTPVITAWAQQEEIGRDVNVQFLARVDLHRPDDSGFDVERWADAAQAEIFRLLHGWRPTGMVYAAVDHAVHRHLPPQPIAVWDPERGVFSKSSTYHIYVSPPPLGV